MDSILDGIREYFESLKEDKKKLVRILLIIFILLLAFGLKINKDKTNEVSVDTSEVEEVEEIPMYVDISGAVKAPGIYEVNANTRLYEVIEKAGGLTDDANIDSINRAAFVEDGQKITIPSKSDALLDESTSEYSVSGSSGSGLININTASKEQLKELTGIGDVMAERIIEYRSKTPFKSKEDIMSVKGIGTATYEKIKSQITV